MPKRDAPIKSVGGHPFEFETRVGAQMLVHLLTGSLALGKEFGHLTEVKFYQRSAGWGEFDDLLLIFQKDGVEHSCGLSLKTDDQLTKSGATRELVDQAWDAFFRNSKSSTAQHYFLGLIAVPQEHVVSNALTEILRLAAAQRPEDLERQVNAGEGQLKRKVYRSFAQPAGAKKSVGVRTGDLLKQFVFREYDFCSPHSKDESGAIELCRTALTNSSADAAQALWSEIVGLSDECRQAGGSYDLVRLVSNLRHKFNLKQHPNFANQWSRLERITSLNLSGVRDQIGEVRLPRLVATTSFENALKTERLIVLYGPSGSGKSGLLGRFIKNIDLERSTRVFLRAGELESQTIIDWIARNDLSISFKAVSSLAAFLLIDGIEACRTEESWTTLRTLLEASACARADSTWRVVFTCRSLELDGLLSELTKRVPNIIEQVKLVSVEPLTRDEVLEVLAQFPPLTPLVHQTRVIEVFRNAKILDVVVTRLAAASVKSAERWVGETSVIDWWWKEIVSQKTFLSDRGRVLMALATELAEQGKSELPSSGVLGETRIINDLIAENILAETDGSLRFAHDLYADWSRLRVVLEKGADALTCLPDYVTLPQWHHAIRLFGAYILESPVRIDNQHRLFDITTNQTANLLLAKDLLFEGVLLTSSPLDTLESIYHELLSNGGEPLTRLLLRFLHTATVPDPRFSNSQRSGPSLASMRITATYRVPYAPLWPPVLTFIERHLDRLIEIDPLNCARIAKLWMQRAESLQVSGQPAAFVGLHIGRAVTKHMLSRFRRINRSVCSAGFEALLAAARELPDGVSDLVLKLVGRRPWDLSEISPEDVDPSFLGIWRTHDDSLIPSDIVVDDPPQSWPNGPKAATVSEFQSVFLNPWNSYPLIQQRPEVAAEALLALLIAWPKSMPRFPESSIQHHGLQHVSQEFPARYWKTPFLVLLRRNRECGLDCLIKLVDFATERTCDRFQSDLGVRPGLEIEINGEKKFWLGEGRVFAWHIYPLVTNHTVGSALLAFEKWLYEELEAGKSVDPAIENILQHSRSIAFLGVLLTVGKKFPALLLGPLKPFLYARDLYLFDTQAVLNSSSNGPSMTELKWEQEEAHKWVKMEHRRFSLLDLCLNRFPTDVSWKNALTDVGQQWVRKASGASNQRERLEWLRWAAKFNDANWSKGRNSEGVEGYRFTLPVELHDKEAEEWLAKRQVLLFAPHQCRELLSQATRLNPAQLDQLWTHLQQFAEWVEDDIVASDERETICLADTVCAYIAVLAVGNMAWLRAHPDRLSWCRDRLLHIIEFPPPLVHYTEDDLLDHFDDFAAEAIIEFWLDDQQSAPIRRAVAKLALSFRYRTVAILTAQAAKSRNRLGKSWRDLETLLLHWSTARLRRDEAACDPHRPFDFDAWMNRWAIPFIESRIEGPLESWKEIAIQHPRTRRANPARDVEPRWPDVNLRFLLAIYEWIPSLNEASSDAERTRWTQVGTQFVDAVVRRFSVPLAEHQRFTGIPTETDQDVFKFIANILLDLRAGEDSKQLWRPILDLVPRADQWVNSFLTEFFIVGLSSDPIKSTFVKRWKEMLDFALADAAWTERGGLTWSEAWEHLLGFDNVSLAAWNAEMQSVVAEIKTYYWRWLDCVDDNPSGLITFLRFLCRPAAEQIICEALTRLGRFFEDTKDYFWRRPSSRQTVSTFVGTLWTDHYEEIKSSADLLAIFRSLVSQLMAYHDPLALEIAKLIGQG
jgi:hypothetical protein